MARQPLSDVMILDLTHHIAGPYCTKLLADLGADVVKIDTGKKIFRELVKDTDIVVENFEPRVMPMLGLDFQSLEQINPELVVTFISNFGQTGPYRDYKAAEIVAYVLGGLMYTCGNYDREPIKHGLSMGLGARAPIACQHPDNAGHLQPHCAKP